MSAGLVAPQIDRKVVELDIERALKHLDEALAIIDALQSLPDVGARLQETIDSLQRHRHKS